MVLIMGTFFRMSRFDRQYYVGADAFCDMEESPVVEVIRWFFRELANEDSDFWLLIRDTTGWTSEKYRITASMLIRVVCGLWYRLILPFTLWPMRLWRIFSPKSSDELKSTTGAEFEACNDCCLEPGLGRQIRHAISSWRDLLQDDFLTMARHLFKYCAVTNVQNEDRFARENRYGLAGQGKASGPASLGSRHVIAEATAWHRLAMNKFVADNKERLYPDAVPIDEGSHRYKYLWNAWCADKRAWGSPESHSQFVLDMRDPAERSRLQGLVGCPEVAADAPAEVAPGEWADATPYSMGCEKFPLSFGRIASAIQKLAENAKTWRSLVAELLAPVDNILDVDMSQCCETLGIGKCQVREGPVDLAELAAQRKYLWALSKLPNPKEKSGWVDLALVCVQCCNVDDPDNAGEGEIVEYASRFFFVGLSLFNPVRQVFWELVPKNCDAITPPFLLHYVPDFECLCLDVNVARWLLETEVSKQTYTLEYTWWRLTEVLVTAMKNEDVAIFNLVNNVKTESDDKLLAQLGKKAADDRRGRATQAALYHAARGRGRGHGGRGGRGHRGAPGRGPGRGRGHGRGRAAVPGRGHAHGPIGCIL